MVFDCWVAVITVLPKKWEVPCQHMLTMAIGLNVLISIGAEILLECRDVGQNCDQRVLSSALVDITGSINLSMLVLLKGICGQVGVIDDIVHMCVTRNQT